MKKISASQTVTFLVESLNMVDRTIKMTSDNNCKDDNCV